MAVLRNLVVKITGDTGGLQKSLGDAQKKLGSTLGVFEQGAGAFGALGAALGPVGIAIGVLAGGFTIAGGAVGRVAETLGDATREVVAFSGECIKLGSDLAEVQNVVDVTFGKLSGHVDAFAESAFKSFGLSELAAKRYTGTMGAMLKSMGLTDGQALSMSTTLSKLAGDFASFYNLDTDEAFTKIRAGISGETEPLKQLGINMSVANLEAYALSQGIKASYEKMDQASKALLRYNYLMSVSADAQGDFARTSGSWANQTRMLKLQWDSFRASIGQALIAALSPVIQVVNVLMSRLVMLGQIINRVAGLFFGAQQASAGVAAAAGATSDGMDDVADSMKKAGGAAKKLIAPFDQLNVLMGGGGGGGGSLMPSFNMEPPKPPDTSGFDSWMDGFLKQFDFAKAIAAWENLKKAMKPLEEKAVAAWGWFKTNILEPVAEWTVEEALPATLDLLSGAATALSTAIDVLKPTGKWLWDEFLKPLGQWTGDIVIRSLQGAKEKLEALTDWLKKNPDGANRLAQYFIALTPPVQLVTWIGLAKKALDGLGKAFDGAGKLGKLAWGNIKTAWFESKVWFNQRALDIKNAFANLPANLEAKFTEAKTKVQEAFAPVKKYFADLWTSIKATFTGAGTQIANAIGGSFKATMNSIFAKIESVVNQFVNLINPILEIVDQIPGVTVGRVKRVNLPRLAEGGVIDRPMMAMVGEAGREAVMPLENNTGWIKELAGEIGAQMRLAPAGGPGGDVSVYIGTRQIHAEVARANAWNSFRNNGRR